MSSTGGTHLPLQPSKGDARGTSDQPQTLHPAPAAKTRPDPAVIQVAVAPPAINTASSPAEPIVTAPPAPIDAAEVAPQIVQAIKLQWSGGVGDARITLKPEYLGEITIAIRVEGGGVTASLESDRPAVREWLLGHESLLRQGLANQGLQLERLVIVSEPARPESERDGQQPHHRPSEDQRSPDQEQSSRRRQPDEPTFEVVV
jgi:flagellar hook-length control protein FliK